MSNFKRNLRQAEINQLERKATESQLNADHKFYWPPPVKQNLKLPLSPSQVSERTCVMSQLKHNSTVPPALSVADAPPPLYH